jgi:hypothetical protein
MRDQDGGAHLDDHIKDETYLAVYVKGTGFLYNPMPKAKCRFQSMARLRPL